MASNGHVPKLVQLRLNDNDAQLVKELADADGRSVTNYVTRVLLVHLEEMRAT
jgi:hypothetical protein